MNLQGLIKIEKPDFYLDKSIRGSNKKIRGLKKGIKGTKLNKSKKIEIKKIENITKCLITDLSIIEKSFPNLDELSIFYQELIDVTIGINDLKKNIAGIKWLKNKIKELSLKYIKDIKSLDNIKKINKNRNIFLGRINSMLKKISKNFNHLENARKILRKFPNIKTNITTISITGLPNVGKSTLLSKITSANPKIENYSFTTKRLMLGYIGKKIQIIDTPGTFRKQFNKMNYIEKQAYLALKYLSEIIIYVFDLTESCGYSINNQIELFKFIKLKFKDRKILIFLSKIDLLNYEIIENFKKTCQKEIIFSKPLILKKTLKKII